MDEYLRKSKHVNWVLGSFSSNRSPETNQTLQEKKIETSGVFWHP